MSPWLRMGSKKAHQQFARIFFVIGALVAKEQDGQVAGQLRNWLGDNVKMFGSMQRQSDTDYLPLDRVTTCPRRSPLYWRGSSP